MLIVRSYIELCYVQALGSMGLEFGRAWRVERTLIRRETGITHKAKEVYKI